MKSKKRKKVSKAGGERIGDKILKLRHEGVPENVAVGAAYGMEKSGRLGEGGTYHRATPKGSRKSPFARYKRKHRKGGSRK